MKKVTPLPPSQRWAQARFAIIGGLLAQPPGKGELRERLIALCEQTWQHPISGRPMRVSLRSIRRWYDAARRHIQPTQALTRAVRKDAGSSSRIDDTTARHLEQSYQDHRRWRYLLHYDNLIASLTPEKKEAAPSYSTVRRYMLHRGMIPRRMPADYHHTPAALRTQQRFDQREVRSYEHTHTHALWHTDAHHGSIPLSHDGELRRPVIIAVIDDHSRYILHAQWYWREDTASVAQTLMQAFAKRGLPRMLMSDNGGPFVAGEIAHGLHRLSIQHETTMCYAPNQNGKIEVFWSLLEGRLLAMLDRQNHLDLYRLNELTQAWVEHDYHRRVHAGIRTTPLERYQAAPHVGRDAPAGAELAQIFTRRELRQQRRSDGTITLGGKRFDIPNRYRHLRTLVVRYALWDLDHVFLANPDTDRILDRLWPIDPAGQASGARREFEPVVPPSSPAPPQRSLPLPPLLQVALDAARDTGLPPAFISPNPSHSAAGAPPPPAPPSPPSPPSPPAPPQPSPSESHDHDDHR